MRNFILASLLFAFAANINADNRKPNILLIVLDDAGYSDVAGFGRNDAPTPNIMQIANEGVRFTRHYADSTCRPARLALMTGREAARVAQNPDFRGMSPDIVTLPEALNNDGYHTVHIGKWHLGDAVRGSWPDQQGFDQWFGFLNQFQLKGPDKNGEFTKRPTYIDPWLQSNNAPLQQYRGHLEDILAQHVVDAIKRADKSQPWFINYWLFAPHHPSTASDEFLKKFPATPEGKYRALLAQADAEIGKAVHALRDSQQLDNTLIVVTSDNGGTNQMMNNNFPLAGIKGEFREGSLRTPLIIRWPDKRAAGKQLGDVVAIQDIYPTLLSAAGIEPAENIDGQDLHKLLAGEKLNSRMLIHEIGSVGLFNYSVLSADGQWRTSPGELYALATDSTGATNVAGKFSGKLQEMQKTYNAWRDQKTRLSLQYSSASKTGTINITGDDFRRAPGYGAFSVAIGAVLPDQANPAAINLISQAGIWSLSFNNDKTFTVQIGADRITSDPLLQVTDKQCVPVVLSSWYTRSRLNEGKNSAYLQLYVGSEKLIDWQQAEPHEVTGDLSAPTLIDKAVAQGNPVFLNTALQDDMAVSHDRLQDVREQVCPSRVADRKH